jgi:hypothetical protein
MTGEIPTHKRKELATSEAGGSYVIINLSEIRKSQMSEIILFTLNAVVIYLFSDWLVRMIEKRTGKVLKQRQVVFFVIFLVLALVSFQVLQNLLTPT